MTKNKLILRLVLYGFIISALIGVISFGFIFLESNLSHHLWNAILPYPWLILPICLLGGVIVGSLRKKWGDYPQVAHHTISELKETQTVDYRHVFNNLTVALFILIFGAGVGPEAALLSSIVMLSVWQADKLRYLYRNQEEFFSLSPIDRIKHMLHPTKYLVTYHKDNEPNHPQLTNIKKFSNTLFSLNGLVSFFVLMKLTEQPSFITKMGETNWHLKELLLLIPLVLFGYLSGQLYLLLKKHMTRWFDFWQNQPIKKALIGSVAIFVTAIFLPSLLFSGQTSLGGIPERYLQFSVAFLLIVVALKLVFLLICLNTGWIGGDIFPIVFAAILNGFAISQLFPTFDAIFIAAVVATSMAIVILDSPVGIPIFVALFFPSQILPVLLIVTLIFVAKKKLTKKLAK